MRDILERVYDVILYIIGGVLIILWLLASVLFVFTFDAICLVVTGETALIDRLQEAYEEYQNKE